VSELSAVGPVVLIGAGKMGLALARGWLKAGLPPARLVLVDPKPLDETFAFASEHGVALQAAPGGGSIGVLVLAVKPQIMGVVLAQVEPAIGPETLVISIAAGIALTTLTQGLDHERVIRTMPNTPAQIGKGITGAVAASGVTEADKAVAMALLAAAGPAVWLEDEAQIDAVTAVSGSGPAYVFHLVEALAEAGIKQGLPAVIAAQLARQTVIGSAALLEADPAPATKLRENVTSPNGTTAAALAVLMGADGLTQLMDRAVDAARRRSEELGRG
jgi:pyrroline-5-carboxylate reductase